MKAGLLVLVLLACAEDVAPPPPTPNVRLRVYAPLGDDGRCPGDLALVGEPATECLGGFVHAWTYYADGATVLFSHPRRILRPAEVRRTKLSGADFEEQFLTIRFE
jgi:hypothetical protein